MGRFMTSPRPHFFFLQLPSKVWVRKWPAVYIEGREDYRHVYGKQLSEIISAGGEPEISETAADAKNPDSKPDWIPCPSSPVLAGNHSGLWAPRGKAPNPMHLLVFSFLFFLLFLLFLLFHFFFLTFLGIPIKQ